MDEEATLMPEPRQSSAAVYRFIGHLDRLKPTRNGFEARCPGPIHKSGDRHASLSVSEGYDGRVILKCHAGCSTESIVQALGLTMADLFEQRGGGPKKYRFNVVAPNGTVATHMREEKANGKKSIWWEVNGKQELGGIPLATLPLWRADSIADLPMDALIFVTEGELKCESLWNRGLFAVGTVTGGGEKCPSKESLEPLRGRTVALWPDNDAPGHKHMLLVAEALKGLDCTIRWVEWPDAPEKGGVSALYRATGSIAFPAVARVVLGVAPDPNDETRRLLLPVKMNIGKISTGIGYRIETAQRTILRHVSDDDQPPVLKWDLEPVTVDATSALDRTGTAQELGASAEVKSVLTELLADGRVPATRCKTVIRESTGVTSETTLSRARRDLGVKVRREGYGEGGTWYWELPSIDTHTRARINGPQSMESMDSKESMAEPIPSIDTNGSNDYKESKALTRARVCEGCGGPVPHPHTTRCDTCASAWRNPVNKGDNSELPF